MDDIQKQDKLRKVFVVWFLLLTVMAGWNFYQNLSDMEFQKKQTEFIEKTNKETQVALGEHKMLRERIIYLEGLIDGIENRKAAPLQPISKTSPSPQE